MKKTYETEREGQIAFFDNYGIDYKNDNSILIDNTDGVYNGNLFEFKLSISNPNKVLFQAIKYLSKLRIKGESVPATILLIDLNDTTVYKYTSEDYRDAIHQVYYGAASKDNSGFAANDADEIIDYSDMLGSHKLKTYLSSVKTTKDKFMAIDINEDCIVGWAERYYRENPTASKGDFIGDDTGVSVKITGEIREPKHFKDLIRPYTGKTNEKFKYLMDCLNDRLSQKDLGAFYTPEAYCKKAAELVQMAVDRVPKGNDYIILDRCAGTGNLEAALIGLKDKNGDDLISHCIVSTYEYYEYKVLNERIGSMVRCIIPPTEADVKYGNGKVLNADAMSEEFINNPLIKSYVDDERCTIILFENPPYFDLSSITYHEGDLTKRNISKKKYSFVAQKYKQEILKYGSSQASARDLSTLFIWSAKQYYLKQPTDSYIVFSPVKYFKSIGLLNLEMQSGFAFNREHFHASPSVVSCIMWKNIPSDQKVWNLHVYDIKNDNLIDLDKQITIRFSKNSIAGFNDKRIFKDDKASNVVCNSDGTEHVGWTHPTKHSIYNKNIICYIAANGFIPDAKHRYLARCGNKSGIEQSYGFMVREDNYLEKLPMWVSKLFPMDSWYDKDVYFNTSDGGDAYTKDKDFLKSCLIYTCLSNQNKCLSFVGSDSRYYRNELCFDNDTIASKDLTSMTLDDEEQSLLELWYRILTEARATGKCNPDWTYGVYQIAKEINTYKTVSNGKSEARIYDYPQLNGDLITLRDKLKAYYKSHITNKMFKYELLK